VDRKVARVVCIRRKSLYALLAVVLSVCAAGSVHAREGYRVTRVVFRGNQTFSSALLREKMSTRGSGFVRRRILSQDPSLYSEEILRSDIDRLSRFYQSEGFLHIAFAEPSLAPNPKKKSIEITLDLEEGEPVRVSRVAFEFGSSDSSGRTDMDDITAGVRAVLELTEKERFRDVSLQKDREYLVRTFGDAGYPYVTAEPQLTLDESQRTVDIRWFIDTGPASVFGDIEVRDNRLVSSSFITDRLAFQADSAYDRSLIDRTQKQLYDLGLFQIVSIKAQLSPSRSRVIPVQIRIKEAPRLTTKLGVGYGKEDEFRTFVSVRRLGFLGGARRLELLVKHSALEPYNLDLKFTQPMFPTPKTALILNPFLRKEDEPGYSVSRLGGKFSLLHSLSQNLQGSLSYLNERIDRFEGRTAVEPESSQSVDDLYNKSGVILGLTFNTSAPMFDPTRGMFIAATFKANGLLLYSDYRYTRALLDIRRYQAIRGSVLALRLKLGNIDSRDSHGYIPVEDRYYTGGSSSVRGWSRSRLGPEDDDGMPLGGKSLLEGSLELRTPLIGAFSCVVFGDFGNVWRQSGIYLADELRYAAGAGLRFDTFIGPIRLDIARPVFDEDKDIQIHFSVGHAF
jgi:outer membrane protein insertion porin family